MVFFTLLEENRELQKYDPNIQMLDQDYTREEFFTKFPNAKTFPQIVINNEHIGGYHDLEKWLVFNFGDFILL